MISKYFIHSLLNYIRNYLVLTTCFLGLSKVYAQEQFQLTNYIYSIHAINPAFSGIEDAVNMNLGFRRQWSAIEGAPLTYYVGFNSSLSGLKNINNNSKTLRKSVPRLYRKLKNEPGSINHGIGIYISGNTFGPFREYSTYATYSFMYQIDKDFLIAGGLSLQYINQRFIADKVSLYNPDLDQVYQNYAGDPANISTLNINAGVLVYGNHFYAGYSLHQIPSIQLSGDNFTKAGNDKIVQYFSAGYNTILGPQLILQPSTLVKYNKINNFQVNVVAKLKYRDLLWGGVSWRYSEAIGLIIGFKIGNNLYLNYSYDYYTGDINLYSQGTHELVLGYRLFSDRLSNQFLW